MLTQRTNQTPAIKIASWNINGIASKTNNKLTDPEFIKKISQHDIVLLIETKNCPPQIHVPGYNHHNLHRQQLSTAKTISGGILVLYKEQHRSGIEILKSNSDDYLWLKLKKEHFNTDNDIYLCAVYDPPPQSTYSQRITKDPLELIEEEIIKYSQSGQILLMGDFNARISDAPDYIMNDDDEYLPIYDDYTYDQTIHTRYSQDKVIDSRGKHLLEICIGNKMRILNGRCLGDTLGSYTCHTYNGSSVVDYAVASESLYKNIIYFNVQKFDGCLSDHCLISLMLRINNPINQIYNETDLFLMKRKIKWTEKIQNFFIRSINSNESDEKIKTMYSQCNTSDINSTVKALTTFLIENLPKIPFKKKNTKNYQRKGNKKWYDRSLEDLRKKLTKKGIYMSNHPYDKNARVSFFYLKKQYKKLCKQKSRQYKEKLTRKLESLQLENPKQYWKVLSELNEEHTNKIDPSTTIPPGQWYDYLYDLKQDKLNSPIEIEIRQKLEILEKTKIFNELDYQITEKEVQKAISNLKNNKSAGLDQICNEMFKCLSNSILKLVTKIFNNILLSSKNPTDWSKGYVTAIHKANDISDPNNYRCLTINSQFGKLFNRVLNSRLNNYLVKNKLIDPCQIGFQKGKRTSDHIYTLNTLIQKYTKLKKRKVYACFIDLKKAFDKVWHLGLYYKLHQMNISTNFYNIIKSMYTENEICFKYNNRITKFLKSNIGVKQGDNLSATLFNMYINDLTKSFTEECDPVYIGDSKVFCLMYADDLIILSETPDGLQTSLDILSQYCSLWKLEISETKTKIIIFENRKEHCKTIFKLGKYQLERVYEYKYLGVVMSYNGNLTPAKVDLSIRSQKAYFKLRKLLGIEIIKPKLYLDIFDKTVVPILTYGSEIWGIFNTKTTRYTKYQSPNYLYDEFIGEKLHTKLCKILLGVNQKTSNMATRAELGRYPLMTNILTNVISYRARLENLNDNSILKQSFIDDQLLHTHGCSTWYSCTEEILRTFNISKRILKYSNKTARHKVMKHIKDSYDIYFKNVIFDDTRKDPNEMNKLRTYREFKNTIKYEPYLDLNIKKDTIKKYTQFRLSSHKLQIETARHLKQSKDRNEKKIQARKCKLCNDNQDEDELHFMLNCKSYDIQRNTFIREIHNICTNTTLLTMKDLFIWLLSNEDPQILRLNIKFISTCFAERENQLKT